MKIISNEMKEQVSEDEEGEGYNALVFTYKRKFRNKAGEYHYSKSYKNNT